MNMAYEGSQSVFYKNIARARTAIAGEGIQESIIDQAIKQNTGLNALVRYFVDTYNTLVKKE